MSDSRTKFYLDPQNGQWKGVCAGIADYTGIDVVWVRVITVLLTLASGFWWTILAYVLIAWMAETKPAGLYQDREDQKFWQGVRSNPKRSTAEVRAKFREIDRRLADIELHYTSRNSALAREIDSLR
ncbi:envelope stress response membrane protein PspC [Sphingomonas yunnanensis]|uniref:envelope stress response membrane protein PspC n=1 Tax=Sphingomonas yunnanensis TaxID=310400 RepID=UPI001CA66633|nr:envelope stress response membrane protein PspC [Sphingomonas yunnanensis]MBY9061839.1 envelope stress response membrane protein PspC [Sphingomonas yunnanensis]